MPGIVTGLSPRVWGSREYAEQTCQASRSIPTCVGQPGWHPSTSADAAVYPHVCGAAGQGAIAHHRVNGLSPRVWGSPFPLAHSGRARRSIPTCVGQPAGGSSAESFFGVYPHVCGAAVLELPSYTSDLGLSPRVWGSQYMRMCSATWKRSIPTCVGQPWMRIRTEVAARVYPHVCGAASTRLDRSEEQPGLSPRVWGSPHYHTRRAVKHRSIPTCVGQPSFLRLCAAQHEVYPHVCGAALSEQSVMTPSKGLSPRVWGSR